MWRVINSVGKGLRSVRPSQCCHQDCSEEDPSKYHNHHYYYNEVSKAKVATFRYYSAVSCRSSLILKKYGNSLGVGEGIHTGSCDNRSPGSEWRSTASYHPRCPPWHWQILKEDQKLEKSYSEKEEKEEKQNTKDEGKTCHSEEWKEVLQSSPTLHALGWGSAVALTWSLYHDWSEHHPCSYRKKNEQQQTPHRATSKKGVKNQDQKNEETLNYHKPFKDCFPFESNSKEVSSELPNADDHYKNYSREIYKVPNLQCNFESIKTYKPNLTKVHECQIQERIIPVYSLHQKFLDIARKVISTQESDSVKEKHKLEEICKDEDEFHDMNESPFSLEDKWSNVLNKTDSGCISDLNQSYKSQNCGTKLDISQNQYNQNEESNVTKPVSDTGPERLVTQGLGSQLSSEDEDVSEHYQPTAQNEPVNNSDDSEIKMLQDRLLEIVKAHHEERLSDMLENGKTLLDTKSEEMVVYYQAGMLMGDITSVFNLALCYHMGHGITQDLKKARKLYEAASAAGHGCATYNLAVMLNQGLGDHFSPQKGHNLLLQAAKMGVKEAQEALSVLEEEEEQQQTVPQEENEPSLRRCYSEPCLFSTLAKEWPFSYSTDDLHTLLDEDDWTGGDFFTVADVSQKI